MIPYSVSYIMSFLVSSSLELTIPNDFSYGIQFLAHGSTLFIYLKFNKLFRQVLVDYIHFKF